MADRHERPRRSWGALRPRSIRARVTLGAVVILSLVICILLSASVLLVREVTLSELRDRAAEGARHVADHIMTERYDGPIPASEPILRFQVIDWETDEVLASSVALSGLPPLNENDPDPGDFRVDDYVCDVIPEDPTGDCFQVVAYVVDGSAYGDNVMALAATRTPLILGDRVLELVLLGASALLIFGSGFVIWYGVGRALRPVSLISDEMELISVGDLHRRLPLPKSDDEIAHLARTANASLARLEEAVTRQRRFVSDASHELRNPIAGMRTKLEVELSDPDPDQRARERLLTGLLSDTERLENIVGDLLEMARLDTALEMKHDPVDLSAMVRQEFSDQPNPPQLHVHASEPVYARVNRLRVVRVLTNLVANAERHATSRIDVIVQHHEGAAVVEVHDDGSGIPVKDRERVFERFARLSESRERDPGGSGLGLAISREIARAHGGTLTAGHSDLLGGAVFTLRLPDPPEGSQ
ncbi:cell wall metabolism sensor histidine kinase WalK [Nocardiopsis sp. B62]|uniref:sensor histidine kinase n=1 Tax=Nocardiopsis sp. B62 TaxID=2824874 RepID=UPI001B362806|nr:HAMP domain-containing sensor histidine kinase [Nocardiopsis sp. B62]MBQ1083194.1 HAMP domain-containing histidine kinase [Nocardiopsis sp. B62]